VNCVVYDAAGNSVAQLADGTLGSGRHQLRIPTDRFEPGVYLCKLQGGNTGAAARFTVVR
jgi:hypothetical protein